MIFAICYFLDSGKSTLFAKLLKSESLLTYFQKPFTKIYYCWPVSKMMSSSDTQFLKNLRQSNPNIEVLPGLPTEENLMPAFKLKNEYYMCVIDDLCYEAFSSPLINKVWHNQFVVGRHTQFAFFMVDLQPI